MFKSTIVQNVWLDEGSNAHWCNNTPFVITFPPFFPFNSIYSCCLSYLNQYNYLWRSLNLSFFVNLSFFSFWSQARARECVIMSLMMMTSSWSLRLFNLAGSRRWETEFRRVRPFDICPKNVENGDHDSCLTILYRGHVLAPDRGMWLQITRASTASCSVLNSKWPDELFSPISNIECKIVNKKIQFDQKFEWEEKFQSSCFLLLFWSRRTSAGKAVPFSSKTFLRSSSVNPGGVL